MQDFLAHLHQRRLSPHTIAAYTLDLTRLAAYLTRTEVADWQHLTPPQARAFATELRRANLKPRSIRRTLSAARAFYRHLAANAATTTNPFEGLRTPKPAHRLPPTLSVDELAALLAQHDGSALSIRDHAMLELLYSCGIRLSELAALDCAGIDLTQGEVRVTGKGNKQRLLPVGRHARRAVSNWLRHRQTLAAADEPALFVNQRGTRITTRGIQYRIHAFAQKHGLGRHLHPHMLRHSFASHLLASSGNLRAVQELLGHANIATTQIYTHIDLDQLTRVYDRAHPRAHKRGK